MKLYDAHAVSGYLYQTEQDNNKAEFAEWMGLEDGFPAEYETVAEYTKRHYEAVWDMVRLIDEDDFHLEMDVCDKAADGHRVIAIGTVGLWNGTRHAYRVADTVREALAGDYDLTLYTERGALQAELAHHDGTHHLTVYGCKRGLSDESWDKFYDSIMSDTDYWRTNLYRFCFSLGRRIEKHYGVRK